MSTLDRTRGDKWLSVGGFVAADSPSSSGTYAVAGNVDDLERHFRLPQMSSGCGWLSRVE